MRVSINVVFGVGILIMFEGVVINRFLKFDVVFLLVWFWFVMKSILLKLVKL